MNAGNEATSAGMDDVEGHADRIRFGAVPMDVDRDRLVQAHGEEVTPLDDTADESADEGFDVEGHRIVKC